MKEDIILQIEDLSKTYQEKTMPVQALQKINLTVYQGEFTALVGPSGGGKTTLFNLIAGLDLPTSGKILINNTEITALSDAQRILFRRNHLGFIFQSNNLVPVLTVYENIALIMQLQKQAKKTIRERVLLLVEKLFLENQLNKLPRELSGGQQQRVAVARALATRPPLVLADEPTANLDLKNAENLLELMKKLNEEEGTTFIFSTHDARVMHHAQRIVKIEDGILTMI
jgi:putative ABC transport system ATP-binding protein